MPLEYKKYSIAEQIEFIKGGRELMAKGASVTYDHDCHDMFVAIHEILLNARNVEYVLQSEVRQKESTN
jgi:hypothetical protein